MGDTGFAAMGRLMLGRGLVIVAAVICAMACVRTAAAQCIEGWVPGDGVPGVNGRVNAVTTWDPDGPGPLGAPAATGFSPVPNLIVANTGSRSPSVNTLAGVT